jgi:hypothetical protein
MAGRDDSSYLLFGGGLGHGPGAGRGAGLGGAGLGLGCFGAGTGGGSLANHFLRRDSSSIPAKGHRAHARLRTRTAAVGFRNAPSRPYLEQAHDRLRLVDSRRQGAVRGLEWPRRHLVDGLRRTVSRWSKNSPIISPAPPPTGSRHVHPVDAEKPSCVRIEGEPAFPKGRLPARRADRDRTDSGRQVRAAARKQGAEIPARSLSHFASGGGHDEH